MPLQVIETPGLKHDGPIGNSLEDKRFILQTVPIFRLNRKKTLKGSHTRNSNVTADFTCTLGTPQKTNEKASSCHTIYESRRQRNARRDKFNGRHS
jgi:hypothetical protein